MTDYEKKIVLDILIEWNFNSYEGKSLLNDKYQNIAMTVNLDSESYSISKKSQMEFVNKFFPFVIDAWNFEFEHIINYYNKQKVDNRNKFYEIMDKYYSPKQQGIN